VTRDIASHQKAMLGNQGCLSFSNFNPKISPFSKEEPKKPDFEIKSLPRPQAPEELKRQPSFKLFVPNAKNAFKTSSLREDKLQINIEKFRGHQVLNPVPEFEPENSRKPVQAVQPFRRNIYNSQSIQVM
jgi:hypothetical protein